MSVAFFGSMYRVEITLSITYSHESFLQRLVLSGKTKTLFSTHFFFRFKMSSIKFLDLRYNLRGSESKSKNIDKTDTTILHVLSMTKNI